MRTGTKKCGGSHHGLDPLDVFITRNPNASTPTARYQIFDITTRTQYFCPNPVDARQAVGELRAKGHSLRKHPKLKVKPFGQRTLVLNGVKPNGHDKTPTKAQRECSPAVMQALENLMRPAGGNPTSEKVHVDVEVSITFTVNGKRFPVM